MGNIWHVYFYDPILNLLVLLYNGPAQRNLGLALIELTILVRVVLLPFTLISLRAASRFERLRRKVFSLEEAHKNDPVRRRESIRHLLEKHHINPWAKAAVLGFQFVVLIVLYRVFLSAIRHQDFTGLYLWNQAPDFLDPQVLGFDLTNHNPILPAVIGFLLYAELHLEQGKHRSTLTNRDVIFRLIFPLSVFFALYALPAGKSIFVLTSIIFTFIIEWIYKFGFCRTPSRPSDQEADKADEGSELIE